MYRNRSSVPMTPIIAFERLFFAVFGQTSPDDINSQRQSRPEWTENLFKLVYGIYMLVSVIVLINLLIAMMSDTYQRIQVIIPSFLFFLFSFCYDPSTDFLNNTTQHHVHVILS
jgi:ABC-type phosphate transport system permease subunit